MSDGLLMKYFVLKPGGNSEYCRASRFAMMAYAGHIEAINPELATSLREWAEKCENDTRLEIP